MRWRTDGNLEFLGRLDHQVKIRGFRIELGEIEAALVAHSMVREAVVVARAREDGDQHLVAYLVAESAISTPELRAVLKASLPEYMIPAAFVFLDALPLTPNGKLDRKALPEPEAAAPATGAAPRDALEEIVAGLWGTVLHQGVVGVDDNFFELGGHSLLATQLASRLRDALGIAVPVRWIFEAPTVAELASRIHPAMADGDAPGDDGHAIPPAPRDRSLPLSFAQQRLWFLDQLEGPSPTYNMPGVLELTGTLDVDALTAAVTEIVRRHEALRTCLRSEDGEPVQLILPAKPLDLPLVDLRQGAASDAEAARLAAEEALAPFDLVKDIPLRARLLRRGDAAWTLLITLHHSAADGWSVGVLVREFAALYAAFHEGRPSPLPELPIQYADFALWQRGWLSGERLKRQTAYWRDQLAGAPECLALPADRPRPPRRSHRGASVAFAVDAEMTAGLRDLSRRSGATLFMTLLAAWASLLGRLGGTEDIVVGSPVANRTRSAIEPLIGFFVNTLALRADLSGDPSFRDLLGRLRHTCLEAYAHQDLPFEHLVEQLGVARNLAHAPLFQVMFVLQNNAQEPLVLSGLEVTLGESESLIAKFDLTLSIAEAADGLAVRLEYATDLFDPSTIERMGGHFVRLLRSVLADPDRPIRALDILPAAERHRLLVEWNATAAPLPEACVHQLFEAQAERAPDATAVAFEDQILSYRELNARANRLALALIARGVGPDGLVAIALDRSPQMIVALLAVLKAGGAYVPLDPDYPAERLAFMLEDSGAHVLITQEDLLPRLPHTAAQVLCLDAVAATLTNLPETNPNRPVAPHQLAYVIYTSGSTGRPKGVAVEHRGLGNLAGAQIEAFGVTPASRVLQFASFSFDASVSEAFMALCAGAVLHLPNAEQRLANLARHLEAAAITHVTLPPAVLAALPQVDLPNLQTLIVAGEPCPPALAAVWSRGRRFFNAYGPTEATVCASIALCQDLDGTTALPIGRPIANTQTYVLDAHGQPAPIGVAGELHIGGAGVARGYLNRPELTAEKFTPDPFSETPGARLYKTGDRVRWQADGNLEFLGRLDHQVKIRGFRIELGEIEAALATHPMIREVVVAARAREDGDQRLVAYVVAGDAVPTPAELRAFLKARLPEYMVPAAFVFLDALPLTPNGKLDRKALPEPGTVVSTVGAAPRDALEEILAGLWATVLHQSDVGIHDNFFELGGHSLLAIQLASRLRESLGVAIPVRWLFEAPTVAELAERIRASNLEGDPAVLVPANRVRPGAGRITPDLLPLIPLTQSEIDSIVRTVDGGAGNVQDAYPLVPLQKVFLFPHLRQHTGDIYLNWTLLAFDSPARVESFTSALQAVIDRHDILRTAVVWERVSEPVQVVWRRASLPVETRHFDPAGGPIAEQLVEAYHPRHTRLDLTRAPLLRIVLAEDGERTLMLFLSQHLIMDHTSFDVLVEEISAHLRGEAGRLPPPVPFRNFVAQTRGGISSAEHEVFFRDMLGSIEKPTGPFGLIHPLRDGSKTAKASDLLPPDLARRLRQQARRQGATPAALWHLAWALVLSRCCGQHDVVFGTELFGRLHGGEGVERAMGMFINTLPVRIDCNDRPVTRALRETQQILLELARHEQAPLSLALRCSAIPPPTPLFSTLFNFRHSPASDDAGAKLDGIEFLRADEQSNAPLGLTVDDLGEGFRLTAQGDPSIDPVWVCDFTRRTLEVLVEALDHAPQTSLCRLDLECLAVGAGQVSNTGV